MSALKGRKITASDPEPEQLRIRHIEIGLKKLRIWAYAEKVITKIASIGVVFEWKISGGYV